MVISTSTSNSWHWKYVWFTRLLIQIHKFIKMLIILINDSSDSNHSSTFSVFFIAVFTKKGKRKSSKHSKHIIFYCELYILCDYRKKIICNGEIHFKINGCWNEQNRHSTNPHVIQCILKKLLPDIDLGLPVLMTHISCRITLKQQSFWTAVIWILATVLR